LELIYCPYSPPAVVVNVTVVVAAVDVSVIDDAEFDDVSTNSKKCFHFEKLYL
jgi:hypothetical protein